MGVAWENMGELWNLTGKKLFAIRLFDPATPNVHVTPR
jgi:hypothetical protein